MGQRVRPCVTFVLREVEAEPAPRNGDEPWKARLELMLPLLLESEPLVPDNSASCVLDVENRHDLLVHRAEVSVARAGDLAWASVRECP